MPRPKKGQKTPGSGKRKGYKAPGTRTKEQALARLRELVNAEVEPMARAQIAAAKGIDHFMLRDAKTGKFERITDVDRIVAALNAAGAEEGSHYWIWAKDPSVAAFTDLLNRALGKPIDAIELTGKDGDPLIIRWQS